MDYDINVMERIQELGYDINDVTPEQEMHMRMHLGQLVRKAEIEGKRLAKERLHTKAIDYVKALKKSNFGSDGYILELNADMVPYDEGFGPFDMKPGLLAGSHAKISKKGVMYNIIPIKGSREYGSSGKKTEFRIVTSNSPKNSWNHPGFAGAQIFDEMASYLEWMVDRLIEETLG